MEKEHDVLKGQEDALEQIKEGLRDLLSLVILLENDMESQKTDNVYLRILKMVHLSIKDIQNKLSGFESRAGE